MISAPLRLLRSVASLLAFAFLLLTPAAAQGTSGTVEGRVLNLRNGEYLERARVTVVGTQLETFTDNSGYYRLANVPAGQARLRVFHTGLVAQTATVAVSAGATAQRDFNLNDADTKPAAEGAAVKLDQFVVSTSKEMDGAAIAINEQRFASNIVNVVAADEFGHVAEGNVGEFLKFLPGMSIDYVGGDARTISMGGVPSNNVPVTVGGFNLASAASSGTSRTVELEQVSINNLAAVPSIIFGLLGLAIFIQVMGLPRSSSLVGGMTLALMTMPVIVISGRNAIKSVPPSIRDAALAVGASPVQTVFHHVLPLALPGILTGTIIGMARALGETAPLLIIGMRMFAASPPEGVTDASSVLPMQIFLWSDEIDQGFVQNTSAAIIVLLAFLLAMNGLAIYLRNKFETRW